MRRQHRPLNVRAEKAANKKDAAAEWLRANDPGDRAAPLWLKLESPLDGEPERAIEIKFPKKAKGPY
jgi:hypothetical protein